MRNFSRVRSHLYYALLTILLTLTLFANAPIAADTTLINPATLVKDINTATLAAAPSNLSVVGNQLLFAADNGFSGITLWASDGTVMGTVQLCAITPTTPVVMSGNMGFFAAQDEEHGTELWRTDGTAAGTQLVVDLFPGTASSFPYELVDVAGTLFFVVDNDSQGSRLWKSDGTAAGTLPVTARLAGALPTPRALTPVNGKLFFIIDQSDIWFQLWVSDGTDAGTQLVKAFGPSATTAGATAPIFPLFDPQLTHVNGTLFFQANDGEHGMELWKSDGTPAGTTLVQDSKPGPAGNDFGELVAFQNQLFFTTADGLWRSDGTEAGTTLVKPGVTSSALFAAPDRLYFAGFQESEGTELWVSDGTAENTKLLKDIQPGAESSYPYPFALVKGHLLFGARDSEHGYELWRSDGTTAGTELLEDIRPGSADAIPTALTHFNGQLFFQAEDGEHGTELWVTDGTTEGTHLMRDINTRSADASPTQLTNVNDQLYFLVNLPSPNAVSLWTSDGTAENTKAIAQLTGNAESQILLAMAANLYGVENGRTLWRYDSMTSALIPIQTFTSATVSAVTTDQNLLFFLVQSADQAVAGLWQSDGTTPGTVRVTALAPGTEIVSNNGSLYFTAYTSDLGAELWQSDGTAAGTSLVQDIDPGAASADPLALTLINGVLFFRADDGSHGGELFKSDGSAVGTALVKDINPGPNGTVIDRIMNVQSRLFFVAYDEAHQYELWTSDGTEEGTLLLQDIHPNDDSPTLSPGGLTALNDRLFFVAEDTQSSGRELWVSNGTPAGTTLFKDINPGLAGSNPSALTAVDGLLFFAATDDSGTRGLWRSDGTVAGTQKVQGITPGNPAPGRQAKAFVVVGNDLFFSADDGTTGQELWKLPLLTTAPTLVLPSLIGAPAGGIGRIPIGYSNRSIYPQTAVTLTAVLHEHLRYLDSTGPVLPTLMGNTVIWQLPALAALSEGTIELRIETPLAELGTRYPVTLTLAMTTPSTGTSTITPDAPTQTSTTVEVMLAEQYYLPVMPR